MNNLFCPISTPLAFMTLVSSPIKIVLFDALTLSADKFISSSVISHLLTAFLRDVLNILSVSGRKKVVYTDVQRVRNPKKRFCGRGLRAPRFKPANNRT